MNPKHLILEGAVRSSKTWLNNFLFCGMVRIMRGRGRHYIITGHTLGSVKRNVLDSITEMFGIDCKTDSGGTFTMFGNKVHCFGAD